MITCTKCNDSFEPTPEQNLLIQQISSKGGKLAMLNCSVCKKMFSYNIMTPTDQKDVIKEIPFLCPISHCGGWVSYIDDETPPFYGCGECGRVWNDKKLLDEDISEICKRFTYRSAAYRRVNESWLPVPYNELPDNFMAQIVDEPAPYEGKGKKSK